MTVGMGRVRKCGKVYDERRRELDADIFTVRLTVRAGSATSALTVSKCENFDIFCH